MSLEWQEILFILGFFIESGVVGFLWKLYKSYQKREDEKAEERAKQDKAMRDAMRSILRNNIIETCLSAEKRGYIPLHDVENLNDMFSCYEALDGNGTTKQLYKKTIDLPHKG